jgi:hypothetical protein
VLKAAARRKELFGIPIRVERRVQMQETVKQVVNLIAVSQRIDLKNSSSERQDSPIL